MTYLSAQGIEHRNLHSHNVLITKDWGAKVLEITYEIITYKRVDWKRGRGGCPPFFFLFFDFGRKKKRYSVFKCFFCRKGRNFVGCALFFFVSFCFKRVIHRFFFLVIRIAFSVGNSVQIPPANRPSSLADMPLCSGRTLSPRKHFDNSEALRCHPSIPHDWSR